jgi:hypothetical protein
MLSFQTNLITETVELQLFFHCLGLSLCFRTSKASVVIQSVRIDAVKHEMYTAEKGLLFFFHFQIPLDVAPSKPMLLISILDDIARNGLENQSTKYNECLICGSIFLYQKKKQVDRERERDRVTNDNLDGQQEIMVF